MVNENQDNDYYIEITPAALVIEPRIIRLKTIPPLPPEPWTQEKYDLGNGLVLRRLPAREYGGGV